MRSVRRFRRMTPLRDSAHGKSEPRNLSSSNFRPVSQEENRMKRVASLSILVCSLAFPLAAQTTALGSFNFKGSQGLQTVDFSASGDERSASGSFSLAGPTLVTDVV